MASPEHTLQTPVADLLENFDCQPILFVGAGLSRRYFDAPDWDGALEAALNIVGNEAPTYQYLFQKYDGDRISIGSEISDLVFEWAWKSGRNHFDEKLFKQPDKSIFLKTLVAEQISALQDSKLGNMGEHINAEIVKFQLIRPHAIITTNYDSFLENIFSGYEAIVGNGVLRYNMNSFGEIFHIHGSAKIPETMIITKSDYQRWQNESQYFASKLLTYFVEHPVIIIGYAIGDPNVRKLLHDIGRIVADKHGLIENVIQVVWNTEAVTPFAMSEHAIAENGVEFRIRVVQVSDFNIIFDDLAARHELKSINPAMIRALAARALKLIRTDIPKGEIEVSYDTLERINENDAELPRLLGISSVVSSNESHPFVLSQIGQQLGYKGWPGADKLLKKLMLNTGIDLKQNDNIYHCRVKTGTASKSAARKWSPAAFDLLKKIRDGEPYQVAT